MALLEFFFEKSSLSVKPKTLLPPVFCIAFYWKVQQMFFPGSGVVSISLGGLGHYLPEKKTLTF